MVALGTRRVGGAERERSPPDSQVRVWSQLQALVYDILPSPTAVFSYVIGSCHLPPNSARYSYATEGALFISAQLSSDAVSASERFGY